MLSKFSKLIKIALISILAIIVVSVIITIINNSHSTFKKATNSKVDIETNNSKANDKEKEYYDFIDTNDFTLKLTEQETLTLIAEAFNRNISQLKKAPDSANTETQKNYMIYPNDGTDNDLIVVIINLVNDKTKKIKFRYISANKITDEMQIEMGNALIDKLIYVATNRAKPEDIDDLPLDTNVKGLHTHLEAMSDNEVSVSIEVEK